MGKDRVVSSAGSNISEIQVDSSVRGRDGETAKHIPPRNQLVVEVDTVNRVHPAAEAEPAPEPGAEMSNNFVAAGPAGRPGLPGNPALRAPQPAGPGQPHFEDSDGLPTRGGTTIDRKLVAGAAAAPAPAPAVNGDDAAAAVIAGSAPPAPAPAVAGPAPDADNDDETEDEEEEQQGPAHENPPPVPDSEEHEVSFLGRLVIKGSEQQPPTGSACQTAVDYLAKLGKKQRGKFMGSVALNHNMTVSATRQGIICIPRGVLPEGQHGLSCNLIHVTCVADHGKHMCFITAKLQRDRTVKFHAYAFVCESEFASRYMAEEVVRACRHVFLLRRIQRARAQASAMNRAVAQAASTASSPQAAPKAPEPEKPKEPEKPREPDDADRLFYHERQLLEMTLRQLNLGGQVPRVTPKSPSRGDGVYYDCCLSMGKCTCKEADSKARKTSLGSHVSNTSLDPFLGSVRSTPGSPIVPAGLPMNV